MGVEMLDQDFIKLYQFCNFVNLKVKWLLVEKIFIFKKWVNFKVLNNKQRNVREVWLKVVENKKQKNKKWSSLECASHLYNQAKVSATYWGQV